jgi:hypothetical protein
MNAEIAKENRALAVMAKYRVRKGKGKMVNVNEEYFTGDSVGHNNVQYYKPNSGGGYGVRLD